MPHQRDCNAVASRAPRNNATNNATDDTSSPSPSQRQRFAIRLSYDGTTYQGFQSQPYGNTIQDQLEHRLRSLLKRPVRIVAWGRTDAGVHARGAVVSVDLTGDEVRSLWRRRTGRSNHAALDEREAVQQAALFLHGVLKQFACSTGVSEREALARFGSISASSVSPVPMDFDARYSALWKRYVYYLYCSDADCNSGQPLPFAWMRHAWRIKQQLDADAMAKAAQLLSGKEHNFEWLSVLQQGELRDPRRTIQLAVEEVHFMSSNNAANSMPYFLEYSQPCAKVYKVTATCDFFLYKMMRRIVGMLVSVGSGNADLNTLSSCIDAHDNGDDKEKPMIPKELVETAPAHGLCLEHVEYGFPI
ncbi:hypothetical protein HJC23_004266 [Cyclotella cryptica]|uniref:tRNA pseudouridine synthase n=1 Tax=Cyclotella cryptica TaxID=29204 RepID=A0ABD3PGJ1_9STRA|eukprot:CCRYP_014655-RA/>CCRYP_014655-RA protein AED:0.05 eAED:0.05 QI:25/1/1/1/0/0/2/441/360